MGAHHRQRGVQPARRQCLHFLQRAIRQHAVKPRIDFGPQDLPAGRQKYAGKIRQQRRRTHILESRQRLAGGGKHFQRAQDSLRVGGSQPSRHCRIASGKSGVQFLRAGPLARRPHLRPDFRRHSRNFRQPLRQRLEIQTGAAGNDGQQPVRPRLIQCRRDICQPEPDRVIHGTIDLAEHPVRRLRRLGRRRPRRQYPQIPVDLHGIGVDNRAAKPLRQLYRQTGLAAGRRACNEKR